MLGRGGEEICETVELVVEAAAAESGIAKGRAHAVE